MKCLTVIGAVLMVLAPLHACFNPADQWAAGVVWTADEPSDFALIEGLGTPGTHYLKEGKGDEVKYIYRSHYAPQHAMVFLGYFTMTYQPQAAPRMAVVLDTTRDKEKFDFARAVRTELDWLNSKGIVAMLEAARQEAEDSLAAAGRGNAQYWTLQREVLSYNAWYTYDTLSGTWSVDAVRANKACGLDVAYQLPPEELGNSAVSTGSIIPLLPVNLQAGQDYRILNLRGRSVGHKGLQPGVYFLTTPGSKPIKIIKLRD